MKAIIYKIAFVAVMCTSCSDWFDVSPSDTIVGDDLYKESTGYHNVLNGVYSSLSKESLYGKELTWGGIECLAQTYEMISSIPVDHLYQALSAYRLNNTYVKSSAESIWTESFHAIADCNDLIERIEKVDPLKFRYNEQEKNLIKGEAIALRAFIHFEMLRLFAPAPINDDGVKYLPYCEVYPTYGEPRQTNEKIIEFVIRDLKEAQSLIETFDMDSVNYHKDGLKSDLRFSSSNYTESNVPSSAFYAYRGYRLNYYAVTALLARVYNYARMHDEAFAEAKKVTDANSDYFEFTSSVAVETDKKRSSDLIFGLSQIKLYDIYKPYAIHEAQSIFLGLTSDYQVLFDDAADYRNTDLITKLGGSVLLSNKYIEPATSTSETEMVSDILPMIRTSEMYYIIAEYYASINDFTNATKSLDVVRVGRNCTQGRLTITTMSKFNEELLNEARREYTGEGQLFYFYKKLGMTLNGVNLGDFKFDLPDNETVN